MALGTTAPEGSVTCPRKVPVVVSDGVDDGVDDCAGDCARAGVESPIRVAEIRIVGIRFAELKTDKYFNTHLILSRQSNFIEKNGFEIGSLLRGFTFSTRRVQRPRRKQGGCALIWGRRQDGVHSRQQRDCRDGARIGPLGRDDHHGIALLQIRQRAIG